MIDQTAVFEKGKMVLASSGGNAWRKGLGLVSRWGKQATRHDIGVSFASTMRCRRRCSGTF
jgi:hypothetical protein